MKKYILVSLLTLATNVFALNYPGFAYPEIVNDINALHISTGNIQYTDIKNAPSDSGSQGISSTVYCLPTIKNYSNTAFSTSTLSLSLLANTTYQFTFYAVMCTSATATGIKPTLNSIPKPNRINWTVRAPLTVAAQGFCLGNKSYDGTALATGLTTFTNNITITGTIVTSNAATALNFMFATELAGGYCQFQEGSASALATP